MARWRSFPDLVFLNCCHLAKTDARPVAHNRLAYSIARELIEIGVRCVVCAGWAVDDDAAATFAETFYQGILHEELPFGDAVFEARKETYRKYGGSITWGAYQAYGDPGWRINPRSNASTSGKSDPKFVAPEELIEAIDRIRLGIYRRRDALTKPAARSVGHPTAAARQSLPERLARAAGDQFRAGGGLRRSRRGFF